MRNRQKSRKTPPLKKSTTQLNPFQSMSSMSLMSMSMSTMSRTQSMSVLHSNINNLDNHDKNHNRNRNHNNFNGDSMDENDDIDTDSNIDEQRGGSLPTRNTLSQLSQSKRDSFSEDASAAELSSMSPLMPLTRTQSAFLCHGHAHAHDHNYSDMHPVENGNSMPSFSYKNRSKSMYIGREKLNFGIDDHQRHEIQNKINMAMSDNQEWMDVHQNQPPPGMNQPFIADFLHRNNQQEQKQHEQEAVDDSSNENSNDNSGNNKNDSNTFVAASQTGSIPPTPNMNRMGKNQNGSFSFRVGSRFEWDSEQMMNWWQVLREPIIIIIIIIIIIMSVFQRLQS